MCFIPFIFTIISEELGIPDNIKNIICIDLRDAFNKKI